MNSESGPKSVVNPVDQIVNHLIFPSGSRWIACSCTKENTSTYQSILLCVLISSSSTLVLPNQLGQLTSNHSMQISKVIHRCLFSTMRSWTLKILNSLHMLLFVESAHICAGINRLQDFSFYSCILLRVVIVKNHTITQSLVLSKKYCLKWLSEMVYFMMEV